MVRYPRYPTPAAATAPSPIANNREFGVLFILKLSDVEFTMTQFVSLTMLKILLASLLLLATGLSSKVAHVAVSTSKPIAVVNPSFLGFNNDWWVSNDPNYGTKWGQSGILTFNLSNDIVSNLAQALSPAMYRIGGTPGDTVVYDIGNPPECPRSKQVADRKSGVVQFLFLRDLILNQCVYRWKGGQKSMNLQLNMDYCYRLA